jgi:hypothetical protein
MIRSTSWELNLQYMSLLGDTSYPCHSSLLAASLTWQKVKRQKGDGHCVLVGKEQEGANPLLFLMAVLIHS